MLVASLGLGTYALIHSGAVACRDVNVLRGALVTVLKNSERAAPSNAYFKGHPDQLRQAEAQYQQAVLALQPVVCE